MAPFFISYYHFERIPIAIGSSRRISNNRYYKLDHLTFNNNSINEVTAKSIRQLVV
jgi:hypothetical protein